MSRLSKKQTKTKTEHVNHYDLNMFCFGVGFGFRGLAFGGSNLECWICLLVHPSCLKTLGIAKENLDFSSVELRV